MKCKICCSAADLPSLLALGYNIITEEDNHFWTETYALPTYTVSRDAYYQFSTILRTKGIWCYIGNEGYTLYISNHPTSRYSSEMIIYNSMFFLGSITRCPPYMFDRIFSDKEQWLMSEFLTTQPKQFLYLATA
ncbi:YaaC family protein [Pedobacter polysacchareus]|uniref:YaaC family protein n=1 Tax=Pedobacter polysacchareus TaxID=2861973 RepID=UPI001C9973DC